MPEEVHAGVNETHVTRRRSSRLATHRAATVLLTAVALIGTTLTLATAEPVEDQNAEAGQVGSSIDGAADTILVNGQISTLNRRNRVVDALAIRDGDILAIGNNADIRAMAGLSTRVINLRGKRVLPGLIDGHLHGLRTGYHCWTQTVRLDLVRERRAALAMYAAKARELADGRWIWTTFGGWNVNQLDNPTVFTFEELTAAAPKNPVWVTGSGFTGPIVNQAALDALGLTAQSPGVVLDENGDPTGLLTGAASQAANEAIIAQLDGLGIEGEARCLADFIAEANSRGLTAWMDAGGNNFPWSTTGAINDGLHAEEPAMHLYRTKGLNARIAFHQMSGYGGALQAIENMDNAVGFLGDDMFRYLGPGEDTMATDPNYVEYTRTAAAKRLSVETHVGDLDAILDGFEEADEVYPIGKLKWRIAHPEEGQPTNEQLARARELGIGWALTFASVRDGGTGPRYRSTMRNSAHMCLASDAMNVAPWAPFQNLWYVTTGRTLLPGVPGVPERQQLTRMQALRHSTTKCAWFIDQEDTLGSLTPGKHADLIVLDKDYFSVPDRKIKNIRSLLTIVDGRVVHTDGRFSKRR